MFSILDHPQARAGVDGILWGLSDSKSVVDPGFPRGGQFPRGMQEPFYFAKFFAKNCMLMKEFDRGARVPGAPYGFSYRKYGNVSKSRFLWNGLWVSCDYLFCKIETTLPPPHPTPPHPFSAIYHSLLRAVRETAQSPGRESIYSFRFRLKIGYS